MAYRKSLPRGEFTQWVEREFEALERAINGTPGDTGADEVSGTTVSSTSADANRTKVFTAATSVNFTIEPYSTSPIPGGSTITFFQQGAGTVTLVAGSGVTLVSRVGLESAGQYAVFRAWQKEIDYWVASGDLVP